MTTEPWVALVGALVEYVAATTLVNAGRGSVSMPDEFVSLTHTPLRTLITEAAEAKAEETRELGGEICDNHAWCPDGIDDEVPTTESCQHCGVSRTYGSISFRTVLEAMVWAVVAEGEAECAFDIHCALGEEGYGGSGETYKWQLDATAQPFVQTRIEAQQTTRQRLLGLGEAL